jgi:hypothetical protein
LTRRSTRLWIPSSFLAHENQRCHRSLVVAEQCSTASNIRTRFWIGLRDVWVSGPVQ